MSFREDYMAGKAGFDDLYDLTEQWGFSDETCTLREYLGLTKEEEDVWVSESDEALEELLEMERNRWIFFTDLDGTLLDDEKHIPPENDKEIHRLLDEGHYVVLTTGRTLPSALYQAEHLGLMHDHCFLICYNGSQIYSIGEKEILHSEGIPNSLVLECFRLARENDIHLQTYDDKDVLTEQDNDLVRAYCRVQHLNFRVCDDLDAALTSPAPKMLGIEPDYEKLMAFRHLLEEKMDGKLDLFMSASNYLELVPPGVNKGNAVRTLCSILGVSIEHSVAAGDAENDLLMIQAAGKGAAMCNGTEIVKQNADYITKNDNNHDGVAEIIRALMP